MSVGIEETPGNLVTFAEFRKAMDERKPRKSVTFSPPPQPSIPTVTIYLDPQKGPQFETHGVTSDYAFDLVVGCWLAMGGMLQMVPLRAPPYDGQTK